MNILGKTLIVLNLLFALLTGGFLVVDFGTRTNWKRAYEEQQSQLKNSRDNMDSVRNKYATVAAELVEKEKEVKTLAEKHNKLQTTFDDDLDKAKKALQQTGIINTGSSALLEKLKEENARLIKQSEFLQASVNDRDKKIEALIASNDSFQGQAIAADNDRRAALARNDSLLDRIRDLEVKMAKLQTGGNTGGQGPVVIAKRVGQPNPPLGYVKGIVTRIHDTDRTLIEISLGSDHGLAVDNTLDVYRLKPAPEYLGVIRIVDSYPRSSVARIQRPALGGPLPSLRSGDEVASSISP